MRGPLVLGALGLIAAAGPPEQGGTVEGSVSALGRPLANAVVYLEPRERRPAPAAAARRLIDQLRLRFVPSVMAVVPGTVVEFRNSDPILHNVFSPAGPGGGFDLGTYPRGDGRTQVFQQLGVHVILCHVHPEMAAYVVVVPTAHHTVAGRDGSFRIEGVPAGAYVLRAWHRRTDAFEEGIVVQAGETVRIQLELEAGDGLAAPGTRRRRTGS